MTYQRISNRRSERLRRALGLAVMQSEAIRRKGEDGTATVPSTPASSIYPFVLFHSNNTGGSPMTTQTRMNESNVPLYLE